MTRLKMHLIGRFPGLFTFARLRTLKYGICCVIFPVRVRFSPIRRFNVETPALWLQMV